MSTTKWSHLPNAAHIDRILESLRSHLGQWVEVSTDRRRAAAQAGQWMVSWDVMIALARRVEWLEVEATARTSAGITCCHMAWDALLCLVAYDDCGYMIDSEVSELKMLAALGDHKAISLLPACVAFNAIK